jgi:hypothetical protein
MDAFVVKLSPAGDLIWATYLGGPNYDRAYAVEVAPDGNIVVAGRAGRGFPTTPGTLQPKFAGDSSLGPAAYGPQDGFVAKLSTDGRTLLWSTYFGGSKSGFLRDADVAPNGDVLLAATVIEDLPYITRDAAQSKRRGTSDAVFARLSPDGRSVLYATYVGGSETIAVTTPSGEPSVRSGPDGSVYFLSFDSSDDFAVTPGAYQPKRRGGVDFLVTRFAADGKVDFATYLGGSGDELCETHCLAVDASGQAYVAAYSTSLDFPMTAHAYQASAGSTEKRSNAVLAVLSADGRWLLHSTYLGGTEGNGAEGISVRRDLQSGAAAAIIISGAMSSSDVIATPDAYQRTSHGTEDGYMAEFSPDLSELRYLTYFGGSKNDSARCNAVAPNGDVVIAGQTSSPDLPSLHAFDTTLEGTFGASYAIFKLSKR